MAAVAERARTTVPGAGGRPRPRSARRPTARRRVTSGVVWIVLTAALLGGVVAMNVAVLQLNLRFDELGRQRAQLRADVARLSSELSSAAATSRIQDQARRDLGVVRADEAQTTYLDLRR